MKKTLITILLVLTFLLASCNNTKTGETDLPDAPVDNAESVEPEPEPAPELPISSFVVPSADNPCIAYDSATEWLLEDPNFPTVTKADWVEGPADAPLTITVYDQFDCPGCKYFETQIAQLKETNSEDFRLVFRHFFFHDNADLPARAVEAAGQQGKFFEMKEFIFEDTENWYGKTGSDFEAWLRETAPKFELDADQLVDDYNSDAIIQKVAKDNEASQQLGLNATPTVYINRWRFQGNSIPNFNVFQNFIEIFKRLNDMEAKTYASCPDMSIDPESSYQAVISTTKGDIVVDLYPEKAPLAVNSFITLAKDGWFENNPLITYPNFIFSGDPSDTGYGFPGYAYIDETDETLQIDGAGWLVAYANGQNLNSSSFIITKTAIEGQSGRTIFGKVVEGLDILEQFESRENIFEPAKDQILSITIIEE